MQPGESTDVESIDFVNLSHHQLRLTRVHELGDTARRLDLVNDPIPVPYRLHRDRGASLTLREKTLKRPALMLDPFLSYHLAVRPSD